MVQLVRRAPAALYEAFGQWDKVQQSCGYSYVGSTDRLGSLRSPYWRQNRTVAVSPEGTVSLWHNHCLHAGMFLVAPKKNLSYEPWGTVRCPWHRMGYTPTGEATSMGAIPEPIASLPETACKTFRHRVWRGLVFELGTDQAAEAEFNQTFQSIEQQVGHVFDFEHYRLERSARSVQAACGAVTLTNFADCTHLGSHESTLAPLVDLREYHSMPEGDGLNPIAPAVFQVMGLRRSWADTDWGKLYRRNGIPMPTYGAVWVTTRMGLMLEYYPGVIVVSVLVTPNPERWWECVLYHDFYYYVGTSRALINLHQRIFWTTGIEDEQWCRAQTMLLRELLREGRGHLPWGFHDPKRENFGPWVERWMDAGLGLCLLK